MTSRELLFVACLLILPLATVTGCDDDEPGGATGDTGDTGDDDDTTSAVDVGDGDTSSTDTSGDDLVDDTSDTSDTSDTPDTADDDVADATDASDAADTGDVPIEPQPVCGGAPAIVELASSEPVFTMEDIPFSFAQGSPFQNIVALPAGWFVVAGDLNINVGLMPRGLWLGAGQYVLSATGDVQDVQHIAYDVRGNVPDSCGEGVHFQDEAIEPLGDAAFLRTPAAPGADGQIFELPPLHYQVSDSGVALLDHPDITTVGTNGCQLERNHRSTAAVGDLVIAVEETSVGSDEGVRNVVMSLPGFVEVAEATTTNCEGETVPAVTPLFGRGEFFIARTHTYSDVHPLDGSTLPQGCTDVGGIDVYTLDASGPTRVGPLVDPAERIRSQGGQVQLLGSAVFAIALDPTDASRMAVGIQTWDGQALRVYRLDEAGAPTLELERTPVGAVLSGRLAVAGPWMAWLEAGSETVHLEQDGVVLEVPAPPEDINGVSTLISVGLSAQGTLLVGQRSQLALYTIRCPD